MTNNLRYKEITGKSSDLDAFTALYEEAFPPCERKGTFQELIFAFDKEETAKVMGAYDNDELAGMLVYQKFDDFIYLMFFAVNSKIRGKGYGSKLIEDLIKKYPNHHIVGCGETPKDDAYNNEQRIARKRFYERHNINYSGYSFATPEFEFTVISNCKEDVLPKYIYIILSQFIAVCSKGKEALATSVVRFY